MKLAPSLRSAHEHVGTIIIQALQLWSDVPFDDLVTPGSENEIHFQQYNSYYIGQVTNHRIKMEDWEEIGLDPKHSLSLDGSVKHNNIPPVQTTSYPEECQSEVEKFAEDQVRNNFHDARPKAYGEFNYSN